MMTEQQIKQLLKDITERRDWHLNEYDPEAEIYDKEIDVLNVVLEKTHRDMWQL